MIQSNCEYEYEIYDPSVNWEELRFIPHNYIDGARARYIAQLIPDTEDKRYIYLKKYLGNDTDVWIPEEIDGIPIRAIKCFRYKRYSFIQRIFVPKTVRFIAEDCFAGCVNLEYLTLEEENKRVEIHEKFRGCKKLFRNGVYILQGNMYGDPDYSELHRLEIPETVHTIASFSRQDSLKHLFIPKTVQNILSFAFSDCRNLCSVEIQGDTVLDCGTFSCCQRLQKVEFLGSPTLGYGIFSGCEALNSVTFHKAVRGAAPELFAECGNLQQIKLPEGIQTVDRFFHGCTMLSDVTFPESLEEICNAFENCDRLHHLILPSTVRRIGKNAFHDCKGLYRVTVLSPDVEIDPEAVSGETPLIWEVLPEAEGAAASSGRDYGVIQDMDSYIHRETLYDCFDTLSFPDPPAVNPVNVINGVQVQYKISDEIPLQMYLYSLDVAKKWFLPKAEVERRIIAEDPQMRGNDWEFATNKIDPDAPCMTQGCLMHHRVFWRGMCLAAKDPQIVSAALARLRKKEDGSLEPDQEIIIANTGVVTDYAGLYTMRYQSPRLTMLTVKVSGCDEITVKTTHREFNLACMEKAEEDMLSLYPQLFQEYIRIPEGMGPAPEKRVVRNLPAPPAPPEAVGAVDCGEDGTLLIPASMKVIAMKAYLGCPATRIVVPEGVTSIAYEAFRDCVNLKSIVLPATLETIDVAAFENCSALEHISFPDGLRSLNASAFSGCQSLRSITIPSGIRELPERIFYGCRNLEAVQLPQGLEAIWSKAFSHCDSLTNISIPQGVKGIGYSAFSDCIGLQKLDLPQNLTLLEGRLIAGCEKITHIKIPDTITKIGSRMFQNCVALKAVSLPADLRKIGGYAFAGCIAMEEIPEMPAHVELEEGMFQGCTALKTANLPRELTSLEKELFSDCTNLTEVSIPASVKKIAKHVFRNCISIRSIIIPEGVEYLGEQAFSGCKELTEVFLPVSLKRIGKNAFSQCDKLTLVVPAGSRAEQHAVKNGYTYRLAH